VFQWQPIAHFVQVLSSGGRPARDIEAVKPAWTG
jgi:hypothetical protein